MDEESEFLGTTFRKSEYRDARRLWPEVEGDGLDELDQHTGHTWFSVIDLVWKRPFYVHEAVISILESLMPKPKPRAKGKFRPDACAVCKEEITCQKPSKAGEVDTVCMRLKCSQGSRTQEPAIIAWAQDTGTIRNLEACSTAELVRKLKEYGDNIVIMTCGHALHAECLLGCLESTDTNKCPSCNQSIILGEATGVVDYLTPERTEQYAREVAAQVF
jgi:hypothetical protein